MGNDSAKVVEQRRVKFEQMFHKNFELMEDKIDDVFGEVSLYKNKNTNKVQVIIKTLAYSQDQQLQRIIQNMQSRIVSPIPNLLSIYHLEIIHVTNAFCGSGVTLKIYIQYLEKSLKEQLRKRRKHKSYYFSEQQLWKILISLINAIKHLHQTMIFHGEIRMENVLIDEDYRMKLVDKSLLSPTNWTIQTNKDNVRLAKGKGVLFSPCILKCLYHNKTQITSYDPFKADIFAIGMIMLECGSLKKAQDFYDYQKFTVKKKDIQFNIYEMKKRYSSQLVNNIQKMLEDQDDDRPNAAQVYEKIRKISNQTIRELNMTLDESFMNESIRSYM